MKKIIKVLLVCIVCFTLTACGDDKEVKTVETINDVEEIIDDNDLKDNGFDSTGLFWKFSFAKMNFSVSFDVEGTPKDHFISEPLEIDDINNIEVIPDKDASGQWLYFCLKDGKFVVDEDDLEKFSDMGRKEAYEAYQENFEGLGLSTDLFVQWAVRYFNEETRTNLIKDAQTTAGEVLETIQENGYNYEKDSVGRQIISSNEAYKIVILNKLCMVLDAGFDLDAKTGYMYIPSQDTCGYSVGGESLIVYRYSDNTILSGTPSLEQFAQMQEIKKWYDDFLTKFSTNTETLQLIK